MTETMTRDEVLEAIEAAWAPYQARICALPEDALLGPTDARGWTVRDHIDHVTAWEASITGALRGRGRHEGLRVGPEVYGIDIDELNEQVRAANADASLADVLAASERGHETLLAAIRALPGDGLDRPYGSFLHDANTSPDRSMRHHVLANTVEHYPEHLAYIERIVAGNE